MSVRILSDDERARAGDLVLVLALVRTSDAPEGDPVDWHVHAVIGNESEIEAAVPIMAHEGLRRAAKAKEGQ